MKRHTFLLRAFILFFFTSLQVQGQSPVPVFLKHAVKKGDTPASVAAFYHINEKDFLLLNDFPPNVQLHSGQEVLIRPLRQGEVSGFGYSFAGKQGNANSMDIDPSTQVQSFEYLKHYVLPGETAASIASDYGLEKKYFLMLNDFPETVELQPDQELLIRPLKPGESSKSEPAPAKKASSKTTGTAYAFAETASIKAEVPRVVEKPVSPSVKAVEIGPNGTRYKISNSQYHIVQPKQTFYRIALIYGLTVEELKGLNNMSTTDISVGQKLKVAK